MSGSKSDEVGLRDSGRSNGLGDRGDQHSPAAFSRRLALLANTIEGEIIPRLMIAHQTPAAAKAGVTLGAPGVAAHHVAELTRLVLSHNDAAPLSYTKELYHAGVSLDSIYLDLLAPTARRLGELWEADERDFAEVTLGLLHLQRVLHELSSNFLNEGDLLTRRIKGRALLAPTHQEQHTFGLSMVAEFLHRDGWQVVIGPADREQLLQLVGGESFDVIGLSISCEAKLDTLAKEIAALRTASVNPSVGVLVGGRVINDSPAAVTTLGADATATDGADAVQQAEKLLALATQH